MKTKIITFLAALLVGGGLSAANPSTHSQGNCTDSLLAPYFQTQEALAADDLAAAKSASKALMVTYKQGQCPEVINTAAQSIIDSPSIKEARVAFKVLSDALIPLVKETGISSGEAYLVHCPMAFDKGADWLQKSKGVANPYFGSMMFSCGSLQAHLAKSKSDDSQGKEGHGEHEHKH